MKIELAGLIVGYGTDCLKFSKPSRVVDADFFSPIDDNKFGGSGRFEVKNIPIPFDFIPKPGGVIKLTIEMIE